MPSKSQSQARLFAAMAHDPEIAKQHGVSMSTAKEWNKSDAEMGNLNKSSKLPKHVKKEKTEESSTRDILDYLNNLELQDEIEQEEKAVQYSTERSRMHQEGCQCDDCSNNEHHYYPDVQHAHDCSCDDCASHIELQEMPQRFDAFAGQDRDEFVDKTAEMTGRHNMVPFAEHADYTVYKNKNGSGFIAYGKDGKQLAVLSGYVSDNVVHGVPNVFVEEAIASKTGTKGVIYTIFTDLLNAGYKILSDELHSDDAIAFWSKLISSHQVYVVGDGEVLARANTQKLHKYWSSDETSPSAELRLLLVK